MNKLIYKTKRGGASMFVVMFTMIILSIITIGFTRLIISEATKTTNTDLSQSAYDSALAGIEDAKMALLQYHSCLDKGYRANQNGNTCQKLIYYMQEGIRKNDCSTVANVLHREAKEDTTENSVVIQETQWSDDPGNNTNMLQAYTCVTIQAELPDYRTTFDSTSRLRIIPIRSANHKDISMVRVKWYSKNNATTGGTKTCGNSFDNGLNLYPRNKCNGGEQAPPILSARLIQTAETFDLSELSVSRRYDSNANEFKVATDTGQVFMVPKGLYGRNTANTTITANTWGETANKGENTPNQVICKNDEWFCTVDLLLPNTFDNKSGTNKNDANTYLLVSLPYGSPNTDISVEVYSKNAGGGYDINEFTGVQARIDSTGRANDLYRRVEARVELVDTYFAYPEFEISMRGGSESVLKKSFYATFNCWKAEFGEQIDCDDSHNWNGFSNL